MKRVLLTVLVLLALGVAGALVVRASGWMNVSAIPPPSGFENWFFGGMSDHSVEAHARPIAPINHDDPKLLRQGLEDYNGACVTCHGAPGLEPSETEQGLNPPPPHLWTADSQSLSDAELYWLVKNGVRMTGMPAFGPTHDETELRAIVAFVRELPKLENGKYAALVKASGLTLPGSDDGGMKGMKMNAPPAPAPAPAPTH